MTRQARTWTGMLLLAAVPVAANQPPEIEHEPFICTVADKPIRLCATVTDDTQIAKARIYFRRSGETFFNFVEMEFGGIRFCGTLPAPREGKVRQVDYYIQAIDDQYDTQRTSSYTLQVMLEGTCEFPPLETDAARASAITVYATHRKQGKKLPDGFDPSGVTFVHVEK